MTRKYFEELASRLKEHQAPFSLCYDIACTLSKTNLRFDPIRFLEASGYPKEEATK